MKKLIKKFTDKIRDLCTRSAVAVQVAAADTSGSDTTEKIGMVVVAIVIVGLLAVAVNTFMPSLFESIISKAKTALEGIF